jgi:cation diffusion facilitator CzcD-associated flavoprotein CzcO
MLSLLNNDLRTLRNESIVTIDPKLEVSLKTSFDPYRSITMPGDKPWPEVRIGNKNHADTAVLIIGAGISGIATAIDLIRQNKCHNFIVVEKSGGIGGTWHDNKYPGCCCDVWSTLYSLSYEQNCEWTREYPGQEEILAYLVGVAQKYKIYEHVRFNTSVEGAIWDDELKKWRVDVKTAEGSKC